MQSRHILKSELKSVDHPEMVLHTFTSLSKEVGYSRFQLYNLYANGEMNVVMSKLNKRENILLLKKDEVKRLCKRYEMAMEYLKESAVVREKENAAKAAARALTEERRAMIRRFKEGLKFVKDTEKK